jgi:hypothetical protein
VRAPSAIEHDDTCRLHVQQLRHGHEPRRVLMAA